MNNWMGIKELLEKYNCPKNLISVRKLQFKKEGVLQC